jgi:hypothetical protein
LSGRWGTLQSLGYQTPATVYAGKAKGTFLGFPYGDFSLLP